MNVLYQSRIYRNDLQLNRQALYLFGDNLMRTGLGGQAGECRGEINAVGIVTKLRPDNKPSSFFSDDNFEFFQNVVMNDLHRPVSHLIAGERTGIPSPIILPTDGWGTGLSELPERAPRCHEWLTKIHANFERKVQNIINRETRGTSWTFDQNMYEVFM